MGMEKVLFLDVDGVLNNNDTKECSPRGYVGIDDILLKRLSVIISKTNASVILSSSWKDMSEDDEDWLYLVDKLKSIGVEIKDKTKDFLRPSRRGAGISAYLKRNPDIKDFVILDDFDFDFRVQGLYPHFVLTNAEIGITDDDVNKAIDILNGKLNTIDYYDVFLGYQHE